MRRVLATTVLYSFAAVAAITSMDVDSTEKPAQAPKKAVHVGFMNQTSPGVYEEEKNFAAALETDSLLSGERRVKHRVSGERLEANSILV